MEDKISRVHLAEEFCHVRLFDEMLRTCGLDNVQWVPLGPIKEKIYEQFPKFPELLMDLPGFCHRIDGRDLLLPLRGSSMKYLPKSRKYVSA